MHGIPTYGILQVLFIVNPTILFPILAILIQGPEKRPPVFKYGAVVVVVLIQRWRWYCSISVYVPFLVDAMAWIGEHRAFVVVEFIRNGESVITAQRAFYIWFQLHRRDPVSDRKTIQV